MCVAAAAAVPLALAGASLAINTIGAVASYQGQKQEAQQQQQYQNQVAQERNNQINENYDRAIKAYQFQVGGEQQRLREVTMAARNKQFDIYRQGRVIQARGIAAAAATGQAGSSFNSVIQDVLTQTGFEVGAVQSNLELETSQSQRNMRAFQIEAQNRASSIQPYIPAPVHSPSMLTPILQIGGAGLDAYNQYWRPYQQASALTS